MQVENFSLFKSQLDEVILHYPQLKIIEDSEDTFLKGILDIPNDDGEVIGSYIVEIKCSSGFPYRFPIIFETGGDIPNEADWHKYPNEACCITVEPDEILICRNGMTVLEFIAKHAIPYFANHQYKLIKGHYKNGEYAHGYGGNFQFYSTLFKTKDIGKWLEYFNHVFKKKTIRIGRNDLCFCGSNKKFKICHDQVFQELKWIGKDNVLAHLSEIIKYLK